MHKKLWKFFIFLFLISFITINWRNISWVFNYEFISRGLESFFERNKTQAADFNDSNNSVTVANRANSIEIPKIGIAAPIIFSEGNSEEYFQAALKKGVLYYPDSVFPGENGVTIILGHSAPPNWPKINYDWVFNDLNNLNADDKIYVVFNNHQYVFAVREKFFLQKGEEIPSLLTNSRSMLVLLSCWPPGKDQERIAVAAELIL